MSKSKLAVFFLFCTFLVLLITGCEEGNLVSVIPDEGYLAAEYDNRSFLAAGTDGRLDRISVDGVRENIPIPVSDTLTDIWSNGDMTLVSGVNGTILYSADGKTFEKAKTGTKNVIFSVTSFSGKYYASSEAGVILSSDDGVTWKKIQTSIKNSIVSIEAGSDRMMAITRNTDFLMSEDGINWVARNFNEEYDGYYDPYLFTCLRSMGSTFFVGGSMLAEPGIPFVMFTEVGDVWMHKPLSEINGEVPDENFDMRIQAIGHDRDQIVAACDKGRLLTVTECSVCNLMSELSEADLYDLVFGGEQLLVVGEGFTYELMDSAQARQYDIKPEQAYENFMNGALIVDVRTEEEYAEGHIAGALNIPVGQIEERLPVEIPDSETTIMFYCSVGKRSQTALETAVNMGYRQLYNLGKLSDWPYEVE